MRTERVARMKTDIQIAQEATLKPITEIAAGLGLGEDDISLYGKYKAKIDHRLGWPKRPKSRAS